MLPVRWLVCTSSINRTVPRVVYERDKRLTWSAGVLVNRQVSVHRLDAGENELGCSGTIGQWKSDTSPCRAANPREIAFLSSI